MPVDRLAVIGTFYLRHKNSLPLLKRLYVDASRKPDEAWLVCETPADARALYDAYDVLYETEFLDGWPAGLFIVVLPTTEKVVPYANKINWALDRTSCDLIVYLDNGSMPSPEKYQVMADAMTAGYGAVYCSQHRTGYLDETHVADKPVSGGSGILNFTQVMHRPTKDRWVLDLKYADPDVVDGMFWDTIWRTLGDFQPVGPVVHDEHHMPSPKAAGL